MIVKGLALEGRFLDLISGADRLKEGRGLAGAPNYDEALAAITQVESDVVLVWHVSASKGVDLLNSWQKRRVLPRQLRGVVMLRGVPFADAGSSEEAKTLQQGGPVGVHIHIVTYSVPRGHIPEAVARRFVAFVEATRAKDSGRPPFEILEPPPWPQNAIAAYVFCLAFGDLLPAERIEIAERVDWLAASRELSGPGREVAVTQPASHTEAKSLIDLIRTACL